MEPDRKRLSRFAQFSFAGFILLCTILAGCGLQSILTLEPPDHVETYDIYDYFKVRIDSDNDEPAFKGLEFYYKFFYPSGAGSVPDSAINIRNFDDLLANGFKRLSSADDREGSVSRPLLYVDSGYRGKESFITVQFIENVSGYIDTAEASATSDEGGFTLSNFELRRGVVDSITKQYKSFEDFKLSDVDISSLGISGTGIHTVDVVLYALSFGIADFSTNVYSKSVYLQKISIDIDIN